MLLPGVPDNVVLIARAQDSGPLKSRCPPFFSLSSCSLVPLLDVERESAWRKWCLAENVGSIKKSSRSFA